MLALEAGASLPTSSVSVFVKRPVNERPLSPVRVEDLAKTIDHTLLRPEASISDVQRLCREAAKYHFATVCVLPYWVPFVSRELADTDVKVCSVISFPYGADTTKAKIDAVEEAITQGAGELDVVMNIPAMLAGDVMYVRAELRKVVHTARMLAVNTGRGQVIVKIIIETCYLTTKYKRLACKIVESAGADFVKTSTGIGPRGATVRDVELLRDCLSESVAVKASGGIRTYPEAEMMINAGAARIGTSAGVQIMREFLGERQAL
jgi:deoxyribose-phosphate aldolase